MVLWSFVEVQPSLPVPLPVAYFDNVSTIYIPLSVAYSDHVTTIALLPNVNIHIITHVCITFLFIGSQYHHLCLLRFQSFSPPHLTNRPGIAPRQAAVAAADDKLRWFHCCAGDGRAGHVGTRWLCWFGRRLVIEKGRRWFLRMDILDDILGSKPS